MTTGVITSEPSPDHRGDALAADAASGATVLYVKETLDFDEDDTRSRWLVVGESEPLEYIAVDEDAGTVTLADPTTEDYEAGLPVVLWDPTAGAKVVEYLAPVRLSDNTGTVDAVLPHELIPLNGIDNLRGASVSLVESNGDWFVGQVFARKAELATITGTTIQTAEEGARIVLRNGEGDGGGIVYLYTGSEYEHPFGPGYLYAYETPLGGSDVVLSLDLRAPTLDDGTNSPYLHLDTTRADGGTVSTSITSFADKFSTPNLWVTNPNSLSATANVRMGDEGQLFRITSSLRYKQDVEDATVDAAAVKRLRRRTWRDRGQVANDPDTTERHIGWIAEEVHAAGLHDFVEYDADGRPEAVKYDRFAVALHALAMEQEQRLGALEEKVERLLAGGAEDAGHGD